MAGNKTDPVVYKGEGDTMNVVTIEQGKSNPNLRTALRVGPDATPVDERYTKILDDGDVSRTIGAVLEDYLSEARQRSAAEEDKPKIDAARRKLEEPRLLVAVQNGTRVNLDTKLSSCLGLRTARVYAKLEGASDTPVYNAKGEIDPEASKWQFVNDAQCNIADLVLGQDQKGGFPLVKKKQY